MKTPVVFTVSQLNTYIKSVIDSDENLSNVYVCAEISNLADRLVSGHFYMTLKDGASSVKAVMFKNAAQRLKFRPENGMSVIARGRISVFERGGLYQLYIDDMQPDGLGALNLAFEQLKRKLEAEGLFNSDRKKPIPKYPSVIGVITSATGAAVKDILHILSRRFPVAQVVLCPVQVQGAAAAAQIAAAVKRFNSGPYADVLIVGRGGGSIEDLWAFNEEIVARAVAASAIPVISAVGHETDYTICDFVADLRAPTPSAAAELAVPDKAEQQSYLYSLRFRCRNAADNRIREHRARLEQLTASPSLASPLNAVNVGRQNLDAILTVMRNKLDAVIGSETKRLSGLSGKLDAMSPLKVLSRGYAVALYPGGSVIKDAARVKKGSEVDVRLAKGILRCAVKDVVSTKPKAGEK